MRPENQYVYQVYLDGSFSKAAEKLFLTQPALSIAIQKIETSIGAPLFDRSKRPLELTPVGEAYIRMIRQTQQLERELAQQIEDIKGSKTGSVRVGGSHYINSYILPDIFTRFSQDHPGIKLEIFESSPVNLLSMLEDRSIDITFSAYSEESYPAQEFLFYPAFQDHILLAVPKTYAINDRDDIAGAVLSVEDIKAGRHLKDDCPTVSLDPFRQEEFILISAGNNLHDRTLQLFEEAGFQPKVKLTLSQTITAYHLAEHDMGITFVSDKQIGTGARLCFYKIDSPICRRVFNLLHYRRGYMSFAAKEFIRCCLQGLGPLDTQG